VAHPFVAIATGERRQSAGTGAVAHAPREDDSSGVVCPVQAVFDRRANDAEGRTIVLWVKKADRCPVVEWV